MRKLNTLILLMLCYVSAIFSQIDTRLVGIEDDFEKILEATKAPGFAVAIVKGKDIIYAKGFGYRDLENKFKMDENTLLAIGSTTKAFTCSVLGQLRDDGLLSFEDSPIKYLKDLRFYNNDLNSNVNIRDLMSHQTGIPRHDYSWYFFPTSSKDSLISRIQYLQPFTGLRQKWHYNNFMYLVQGSIIEHITGYTWEQNIRDRFFEPLDMTRSNLSIDELLKSKNVAIGYELYKDSLIRKLDYYRIAAMSPAGSINSTVIEMANWLIVWINKGKFNEKQILPEMYIKEAISSQSIMRDALPNNENPDIFLANYGLGWAISSYRGHYQVEHGGNIDGFSANVAFFPYDSIGVVVLANQNISPVPTLVRNTISDRLLANKKYDWTNYYAEQRKKQMKAKSIKEGSITSGNEVLTDPSHKIEAYVGKYYHPGYGKFDISINGESLYANFINSKFLLKHIYFDVFESFKITKFGTDSTPGLKFNFCTNENGVIESVKIRFESTIDPIEFKYQPEVIPIK